MLICRPSALCIEQSVLSALAALAAPAADGAGSLATSRVGGRAAAAWGVGLARAGAAAGRAARPPPTPRDSPDQAKHTGPEVHAQTTAGHSQSPSESVSSSPSSLPRLCETHGEARRPAPASAQAGELTVGCARTLWRTDACGLCARRRQRPR